MKKSRTKENEVNEMNQKLIDDLCELNDLLQSRNSDRNRELEALASMFHKISV